MRTLITNARLVDGSGAPAREGELLVEDERIAEVGGTTLAPDRVLDVGGRVVAPGFIDIHSHNDFLLPDLPRSEPKLRQGITTEVVGNCGLGLAPATERVAKMYQTYGPLLFGEGHQSTSTTVEQYRQRLESKGVSVNVAALIPHGNVRCAELGMQERAPTADELQRMRDMVDQGMRDGAFGLSTGLVYPPGAFAETEELIELAKVVATHGGIYASHIRDEAARLEESVQEALRIGEEAGLPVQISHHKVAGRPFWGKVKKTLAMVDRARAAGHSVHSDVYPYTAGSTVLGALMLPLWVFEGSHADLMARLGDREARRRIIHDARASLKSFIHLPSLLKLIPRRLFLPLVFAGLSKAVIVTSVKNHHEVEGKSLKELMRLRKTDLLNTILDLLCEEEAAVVVIAHVMCEEDVCTVMQHEATMIGSDGLPMREGTPHPRTFGTFPRVLARYVRDRGLLSLEEAVRRMTSMSAQKLGLSDRGLLEPGGFADVVVFDPDRVADTATYEKPRQFPHGIPHVFVRGEHTIANGEHTGALAGRVLRSD